MTRDRMRHHYGLELASRGTSVGRQTLFLVAGIVVAGGLIAGGVRGLVMHSQRMREQRWINTSGTIQDVRGVLAAQVSGYAGGGVLYNVQVLATYPTSGSIEKRWIRVGDRPTDWTGVELAKRKWQGRHCLVWVNPKNREQVEVELLNE